MCGIAGIIKLKNKGIHPSIIKSMTRAIDHRGPDDEGYLLINNSTGSNIVLSGEKSSDEIKLKYQFIDSISVNNEFNLALSHKRFSIIDLSSAGFQPLFDIQKKCAVILNGEIYNYIELREELIREGYKFNSQSDTEVLLNSYLHWGNEFYNKMNGFWAFALYDFRKNKLILSRDRFGKKPLYWYKDNDTIYFASEIKSILNTMPNKKLSVNENLINNWLINGYRDISSETFYDSIYSLPAASFVEVNTNFPDNIKQFWNLPVKRFKEKDVSVKEASNQIRLLLEDSVRVRLRADVPWCVELSGGMDSSALVGIASELNKNKIQTYTVEFPEKEWNEEPYARSVAQRFNVIYSVIKNPIADFWGNISAFTYHEEEPYHSPNLHTNQVIWSMMREKGSKISLNGAAGDEIFAGYGYHYQYAQIENLLNFDIINYIKNISWTESESKIKSLLIPIQYLIRKQLRINLRKKFWIPEENYDYLNTNLPLNKFDELTLSKVLINDILIKKIPYWMRSGDKGFMGIPIEVRAPFLDFRLVEYTSQLPITYLIRNGWHKWILRKSLEDLLPADVLWRKRKMGFPFPYETFYQKNKNIIDLIFNNSENPYLNFNKSEKFRNNWNVISFILWYEYFINRNYKLFEEIERLANTKLVKHDNSYIPEYINTYNNIKNEKY